MTDLEKAKSLLDGHSICLCKGESTVTDDGRGISPMMRFLAEDRELSGYSAADVIVGRAAAMLFVKVGIAAVYGTVMSQGAKTYLEERGIPCSFGTLCENIINREGTDICPMEKTVADISDPDEGYAALKKRLAEMKKQK